jgi:hypothetical protein
VKTLEDATVAELDALAAQHSTPEYPAEGLKAEKYEALANQLGEGYQFDEAQAQPPATVELELADPDANAAQFAIGDEQVEIARGDTLEVEEREGRRLVAAFSFLKVAGESAPEQPEELEPDTSSPVPQPGEEI